MEHNVDYLPQLLASLHRAKIDAAAEGLASVASGVTGLAATNVSGEDAVADAFNATADEVLSETEALRDGPADVENALADELRGVWNELSEQSRISLIQGDRLRLDIETYFGESAQSDFAVAVVAYSRALEIELFRRLFKPLRDLPPFPEVVDGTDDQTQSIEILRRFQQEGSLLSMGQMAACLENLTCGDCANEFDRYVGARVSDPETFCSARYSRWLTKFAIGYRNRAAHISRLSSDDCKKARSYLLDEPRRLLLSLVDLAPVQAGH